MRSLIACAALALASQMLVGCAQRTGANPSGVSSAPTPRASTMIDSTMIGDSGDRPLVEIIAAHIPGVRLVRGADGGLGLHIRGESSVYNSGQPLIVIDGLQIEPGQQFNLAAINPHDIASIEVVKDSPALSLYGIRGANGVVIIRTKKPGS